MYDPATGRFWGLDQSSFSAGDANLYRYVGNSPTNGTDPSGNAFLVDEKNDFEKFERYFQANGLNYATWQSYDDRRYYFFPPTMKQKVEDLLGADAYKAAFENPGHNLAMRGDPNSQKNMWQERGHGLPIGKFRCAARVAGWRVAIGLFDQIVTAPASVYPMIVR